MEDNQGMTYHAGNMRPSHRPDSVQEVLDIIQQQNHYSTNSATQAGDVSKNRNPLPAIKASLPQTVKQHQNGMDENNLGNTAEVQLENPRLSHDDLRKHTQRLNLNEQNHNMSGDIIKTTLNMPSGLQREGTRHQLPPLSLKWESKGNNVHSDRNRDDPKRGTISGTSSQDSHTQVVRPSTGYGRRLRAASVEDELCVGTESRAAQSNGKSSNVSSKGKDSKSEQRPRSSYGNRSTQSREHHQETVQVVISSNQRDTAYEKHNDLNTKHTLNIHGKPTSSKNKHRPLRVCRSHDSAQDYSGNQQQERNMTYAMSNTTDVRPKSSKGRCRKPPSPQLVRPESDLRDNAAGMDLIRPGAPIPPSDFLDDEDDFTRDAFVARNHTSRLMTL